MHALFDSDTEDGKSILYYIFNCDSELKCIESVRLVPRTWLSLSKTDKKNIDFYIADLGVHFFNDSTSGNTYKIDVSLFNTLENITRQEPISDDYVRIISIVYDNIENLNSFKNNAMDAWKKFVKSFSDKLIDSIKKYTFEIGAYKLGYWNSIGDINKSSKDNLFLKEGEKELIFNYIDDFVKPGTKKEYHKYGINYKTNILLYGIAGTGKTKTCLTIASHLNSGVGILPFTADLTDATLISAINNINTVDCSVIILEDVDCLFIDRKKGDTHKNNITLAGLLNILDGISRNEDLVVILTANNIEALDDAIMRSMRMDLIIKYDYANEYQIKNCFKFYRENMTDEEFQDIYKHIKYKNYTIADIQKFLFENRKQENLLDKIEDLKDIIKPKKDINNDLYI
jgi:ATPase family associated with various cellular activities (AAA)